MQDLGIGPILFTIYTINLLLLGLTKRITKYADASSLLVPEKCDIDIGEEFKNILVQWEQVKD